MSSFTLSSFSSFGIGGSRAPGSACSAAASAFLGRLVALSPSVFTSCASGVCASVRAAFPAAVVSSVVDFPALLPGPARAARAAALVRSLLWESAPLWVCFPSAACPAGLSPSRSASRCWAGFGSGSWSESAFAVGLGLPVLLFLPVGVVPPAGWGAWSSLGRGWWFLPAPLSLF